MKLTNRQAEALVVVLKSDAIHQRMRLAALQDAVKDFIAEMDKTLQGPGMVEVMNQLQAALKESERK